MTDSMPQLPTTLDILGKPALQSMLISRAAFWQPRHIWSSKYLKNIPFFFWLVESTLPQRILQIGLDDGISFLSFCQAVDKLRLDASCIGLTLNDHEASLIKLSEVQEAYYPDFSLIEKYVPAHVNDKINYPSVDMLVIGSGVAGNLLSDLRANLFPRLSENAVIVILEPVQLFLDEKGKEILHALRGEWNVVTSSNDLSSPLVLFQGAAPSERLRRLYEMSSRSPEHLMFWQILNRLGQGIADFQLAKERKQSLEIIQKKADHLSDRLEDYEDQIAVLRSEVKTLRGAEEVQVEQTTILRTRLGQLQAQEASQASQIAELQEKLTEAQEKRQAFYARSTELQTENDRLKSELEERINDIALLSQDSDNRIKKLDHELQTNNKSIENIKKSTSWRITKPLRTTRHIFKSKKN
jgi:predicted  nucleic acid-binding Zn-ribbon protein